MAHFPSCPLSIPNILTTSTMSSPLLVVALPLLLHRHLLAISRRAASASQCAAACCLLLIPVASCLLAGCHVASHHAATLRHILSHCPLTCPSSSPRFDLHWLVVALHLGCCVASCCAASASRPLVNTAASRRAAASHLLFASCSPRLVATLPHVALRLTSAS